MSREQEQEEVERVLRSTEFRHAPKLRRFLELVCQYHFLNKSGDINEFLIAIEAFGKSPTFNPGEDSIVRVQAHAVRRRLREYYQTEGKDSGLILTVPVGSYAPVFTPATGVVAPPGPASSRKLVWTVSATVLVCIAILLAVVWVRRQGQRLAYSAFTSSPPLVSNLWNRFTKSEVSTLLVLDNPNLGTCEQDRPADGQPASGTAARQTSCPDEYTGMGGAVALHLFTMFFQANKKELIVKQSRMVTEDDVRRYNMILLGDRNVNVWTGRLGGDLALSPMAGDLLSSAGSKSEEAPGSETFFDSKTGQLIQDRALIALRRNPTTGHWLLFLYGKHTEGTQAAAEATLDESFLVQLQWPASVTPFPDRFCILADVTVSDGLPEGSVPVALRVP